MAEGEINQVRIAPKMGRKREEENQVGERSLKGRKAGGRERKLKLMILTLSLIQVNQRHLAIQKLPNRKQQPRLHPNRKLQK